MEFAYLDESGDLGSKGSKFLILTLMCTARKKEIVKVVRDTKKRLLEKNRWARWLNRHGGEIKFYNFPDEVLLMRTLKKLADVKIKVYYLAMEKGDKKINQEIKSFILEKLFKHIFEFSNQQKPKKIIADLNFFNKKKINRFILQKYNVNPIKLKDKEGKEINGKHTEITFSSLNEEDYNKLKEDNFIINVEHQNSRLCEELQALDLISGSIFAFIENGDKEYVDILSKGNIEIEGNTFKKNK